MSWTEYFTKLKGAPPRPSLLRALELFDRDGFVPGQGLAIDLGCGAGQDSLALLARGWNVLSVDQERESMQIIEERLREMSPPELGDRHEFLCSSFEEVVLPPADFINASFSLPFCSKEAFPEFWQGVVRSIRSGGRFAGQFFGPEDDWVRAGTVTGHEANEMGDLFRGFQIEAQAELKERKPTAVGGDKNWHIITVIARKL